VRFAFVILFILWSLSCFAQGPYAPSANQAGTTAIHSDSSVFVAWALKVEIQRGKQNISSNNSDTTTVGNWSQCLGKATGTVVSLGDSGVATMQFDGLIYNGVGPDFAVFENAFNHTFLELAFVEVSSNGVDFFRFPSHSLTDTVTPVGSFGSINPTQIHNLAGKYIGNYGTPFDLADLDSIIDLDVNAISHVRLVDVVGSLSPNHAQRDSKGRKVNDQYPTPFPSGGFDLDAVGVIYMKGVGIDDFSKAVDYEIYPNPSNGIFQVKLNGHEVVYFELYDLTGRLLKKGRLVSGTVDFSELSNGTYALHLMEDTIRSTKKIIIQ
jgi:hypothetical protein